MSSLPDVLDLRLVEAVARHGSVGAAARELLVSQPTASQRLSAVERRVGLRLFERDTTGARPTAAGAAYAVEAAHILRHLGHLHERTRAAAEAPVTRVGTFPSLESLIFPVLDEVHPDLSVHQVVDHGDRLVADVAEGSLDVAIVALAGQMTLPPGVVATPLGRDRLVMVLPGGVEVSAGRRPFAGHRVPWHTVDLSGDLIHRRVTELGGVPRRAASALTAILTARQESSPALMARSLARAVAGPDERIVPSPVKVSFIFHAVTRAPAPAQLLQTLPRIRRATGMVTPS